MEKMYLFEIEEELLQFVVEYNKHEKEVKRLLDKTNVDSLEDVIRRETINMALDGDIEIPKNVLLARDLINEKRALISRSKELSRKYRTQISKPYELTKYINDMIMAKITTDYYKQKGE